MNSEEFLAGMELGTQRMGLCLDRSQLHRFALYFEVLKKWNQNINLVSKKEPDWLRVHFMDSLAPLPLGLVRGDESIVDLGSGAGFPGLALKIACPALDLVMVESSGKKCTFLKHATRRLEMKQAQVLEGRFNEVAPARPGGFDLVVSRASAKPLKVLEEAMPFLGKNGRILIYTSEELTAKNIGRLHGYTIPGSHRSWVLWEVV